MERRHTPGPWIASRSGTVWHVDEKSDPDPSGNICTVWNLEDDEENANAHLIAAAPEMKELLDKCLAVFISNQMDVEAFTVKTFLQRFE